MLYSSEIRNIDASKLLDTASLDCLSVPVSDYALLLINGVEGNKEELDGILSRASKNWSIERMPIMDLAILRIALFEMIHVGEVPISVSINEAVELAKSYGGEDDSPKFINGILGTIARNMDADSGSDGEQTPQDAQAVDNDPV